MNGRLVLHIVLILLLQLFVFSELQVSIFDISTSMVFLHPLIIIVFPLSFTKEYLLIIAFIIGLIVDIWCMTPGVHTAALVGVAYLRPFVHRWVMEDKEYNRALISKKYAVPLVDYVLVSIGLLLTYSFLYHLLQNFTFLSLGRTIMNSISSGILSFAIAFVYNILLKPS